MPIVKYTNPKTGVVYAYESTGKRSPQTQRNEPVRTIWGVLIQKLVRLFPRAASVAVSVVFPQRSEKRHPFPRLSMKTLCSH